MAGEACRAAAQQRVGDPVAGAHRDAGGDLGAQRVLQALGDLARGVVHEGQRTDLLGSGMAGGDEPCHARDQDSRLAGAGAGDDGDRAVRVLGGGPLAFVEGRQRPVC